MQSKKRSSDAVMKRALQISEQRYKRLFKDSPVAHFEVDATDLEHHISELKQSGIKDFRTFFSTHPEEINKCISGIKIVDANRASMDLLECSNVSECNMYLRGQFLMQQKNFLGEAFALRSEKKTEYTFNMKLQTAKGTMRDVIVKRNEMLSIETGELRIIITLIDITEFKKIEMQLIQSKKMEVIGKLAGSVAHDFNNLLQVIMGYAEYLSLELGKENPLQKDVEEIQRVTKRAVSLTQKLLSFTQKETLHWEIVNVNDLIGEVKQMLRRILGDQYTLETRLYNNLSKVQGERNSLELVLMNLIINAKEAMPKGGKITIVTENKIIAGTVKLEKELQQGSFICISIGDTGRGIKPEDLPFIYEPFFTTKQSGLVSGLGLSMAQNIVKQHNGLILCESEVNRGSLFRIFLPVYNVQGKR